MEVDLDLGDYRIENGLVYPTHKNVILGNIENLRDLLQNIRIEIVNNAKKYIGFSSIKYKGKEFGMDSELGFDCSGFVTYILDELGLKKDKIRHANEYFDSYGINIHEEVFKPGDLIFFSKDGLVPKHMGIVISDDEYIHAPGKDNTKVEVKKITKKIIDNNIGGKIYIKNPIGYKRIVLESSSGNFDFNHTGKKRWTKIV